MDMLGSPYGSENPTASGVIGNREIRKYSMKYSANVLSRTLRDNTGVTVEADPPLFWCP